jgi:chromosome segregation ATPase
MEARLKERINQLEKDRDLKNAEQLIGQQIEAEKKQIDTAKEEEFKEEIHTLKENLERKEYLLQYNEEKYHQYEKVLRSLILDKSTPEPVKDQLREKIESQELFVPKEERKITNLVHQNSEMQEQINFYKEENKKLQLQVEELSERMRQGFGSDIAN